MRHNDKYWIGTIEGNGGKRVSSLSKVCQGHVYVCPRFCNGWGQASMWWLDQKNNSESECRVSIYRQHCKAGQLGCFDNFSQKWQKSLLKWLSFGRHDEDQYVGSKTNWFRSVFVYEWPPYSHSWSSSILTVYRIIFYVYERSLEVQQVSVDVYNQANVAWSQLGFFRMCRKE